MNDLWQNLAVAVVVVGAFGYTFWALMPMAWRHPIKVRLGLRTKPSPAASACAGGCASCSACTPSHSLRTAVIQVHRRTEGGQHF